MRLVWPLALFALLFVPLAVVAYLALERRRARYAIHYTNIEVLAAVAATTRRWRALLPPVLILLALTCATAALARPQIRRSVASEQASIALVVDMSGSMSAEDVKPTRLGAAQEAVRRFLARIPAKYRVGLVTFSSEPYVAAPLTYDRRLVLQGLVFGSSFGQGTAIGDALARSVELLQPLSSDDASGGLVVPPPVARPADGPLSAILLLSDGAQTRGVLAPLEGAQRAKSYGIPVYTVALGTPSGVLKRGGFERPVPPDPATLRQIAQSTGGEFFATQSEARLNAVYEDLASRLGKKREWRELSFALVGAAALLALAASGLSLLWVQRLP
ncbi:MAG: Ca-activated chloride channel [Gaiellales bacterium]|jgi:Ca-activated chloride channel family protein|nr:Ca-activated chloride channel [Gaiellales bacterium]